MDGLQDRTLNIKHTKYFQLFTWKKSQKGGSLAGSNRPDLRKTGAAGCQLSVSHIESESPKWHSCWQWGMRYICLPGSFSLADITSSQFPRNHSWEWSYHSVSIPTNPVLLPTHLIVQGHFQWAAFSFLTISLTLHSALTNYGLKISADLLLLSFTCINNNSWH